MNTRVEKATQEYIDMLKGKLREADELECQASMSVCGDDALQYAFEHSPVSWIGFIDDKPILAFGVGAESIMSEQGAPWLLGTDDMNKVNLTFLKLSNGYVGVMTKMFPYLENFVDARNKLSIRWLAWCGFTIEPAEPFGPEQLPFHRFWLRSESCVPYPLPH